MVCRTTAQQSAAGITRNRLTLNASATPYLSYPQPTACRLAEGLKDQSRIPWLTITGDAQGADAEGTSAMAVRGERTTSRRSCGFANRVRRIACALVLRVLDVAQLRQAIQARRQSKRAGVAESAIAICARNQAVADPAQALVPSTVSVPAADLLPESARPSQPSQGLGLGLRLGLLGNSNDECNSNAMLRAQTRRARELRQASVEGEAKLLSPCAD